MRTSVMAIVGWLLATAAAVALGIFATSLIGNGITSGAVASLGEDKVAAALASVSDPPSDKPNPPAASAPSPSSSPSSASPSSANSPSGSAPKALQSPGGSVVARCTGNDVYLVSWTPEQGFQADDDVHRGPGPSARVKFKSEEQEYRMEISCSAGVPQSTVEADD